MNPLKIALVPLLLLAIGSPAIAELHLSILSRQAANVWIDDQFVGETPARMEVQDGALHQLVIEEKSTGQYRIYDVQGKPNATARQTWNVDFHGGCHCHEILTRTTTSRPVPSSTGKRGIPIVTNQSGPLASPIVVLRPRPRVVRKRRPAIVIRPPVIKLGHHGRKKHRHW